MAKKIFKVKGMDCDSCAKMIELDLEDAGITASCSYAKQSLEVDVEDKTKEAQIKEIISKSGYAITPA